jgi:hypothetical protein
LTRSATARRRRSSISSSQQAGPVALVRNVGAPAQEVSEHRAAADEIAGAFRRPVRESLEIAVNVVPEKILRRPPARDRNREFLHQLVEFHLHKGWLN